MFLRRDTIACLNLLAVALVGVAPARAQTTLRYQFKEGDKLPYVMEQKMDMKMNAMGQDIEMKMTQVIDLTWNVGAVDKDGKAKVAQRFERIRFNMDGPTGKVEFDSKDGKEPEGPVGRIIGPMFQAMVGSEISMTMDPQGRFSDVRLSEKLTEAFKKLPAGAAMGDMFSEEGLKRMVGQGSLVLRDKPVVKGDTWDQKLEMKMPFGKMRVDTAYTYEGPAERSGRKLEKVGLKPKLTIEADAAGALQMKVKDQEADGAVFFDNAAGRLVETKLTQNMTMEISVGGQNLAQKIKQTVSMKLQEEKK